MHPSVPSVDVADDAGYGSYEEDDSHATTSGHREESRIIEGEDSAIPRLCLACKHGSLDVVRKLIESKEDVHERDQVCASKLAMSILYV